MTSQIHVDNRSAGHVDCLMMMMVMSRCSWSCCWWWWCRTNAAAAAAARRRRDQCSTAWCHNLMKLLLLFAASLMMVMMMMMGCAWGHHWRRRGIVSRRRRHGRADGRWRWWDHCNARDAQLRLLLGWYRLVYFDQIVHTVSCAQQIRAAFRVDLENNKKKKIKNLI